MSSAVPVIAGFHPDPSICRVGEDYYLVNSSFEYLPALPVHHSRDLHSWRQIGNILDRPEQISHTTTGRGIYAPTLRHHEGRFWLVTTDTDRIGHGQLLVTATDPAGPWSDPVFVEDAIGIDPDLAWDDDGHAHLTWAAFGNSPSIVQAEIDLHRGLLTSPVREIWAGTGLAHTEGPHLYRRDAWWFLLTAEGGTERGHGVSVARSRSISGPFESHPGNPIFSHRSRTDPVQNTGHADLVQRPDGSWAMVFLGVRPRGFTPRFHVNGRETFLGDVTWDDDWPILTTNPHTPTLPTAELEDTFASPQLEAGWISPGRHPSTFARAGNGLQLTGPAGAALLRRVGAERWEASLEVTAGDAALLLRVDDHHFARVGTRGGVVVAELGLTDLIVPLKSHQRPSGAITLVVRVDAAASEAFQNIGPDRVRLGLHTPDGFLELGSVDGRYLSTEVAGGFTGRTVGAQLLGDTAHISVFRLHPIDSSSEKDSLRA